MEDTNTKEELRQSSLRPAGSLKSGLSGRYNPRNSPTIRRLHSGRTPRKEYRGGSGAFQWFRGNRVVFWLLLITLWAYMGFYVQSKWAHNEHSETEFIRHKIVDKVGDTSGTGDASGAKVTQSMGGDPLLMNGNEKSGSKKSGISTVKKGRHISSSHPNANGKKKRSTLELKTKANKTPVQPKPVVADTKTVDLDDGIPRKNTSYGLIVGPFGKIEDSVLEWSPEKRKGTCDRTGDFARIVWSRRFVLVFHELSMTGAPLSMMELATEILSCGGYLSVIALSMKGGLMGELNRRGIKVLEKGEFSFKTAKKSDLIVAGSTACSSWVDQYYSHFTPGSSQVLWWIMENQREDFDRSKHLLDSVKMLTFQSETQMKQWLTWCEEEKIKLKMQPTIVPFSVHDELAFVAGFPCSLNTPLFSVEKMQEKKNLLRVAVRKEMGLSDDDMLVMSLSSINPGKGQLLLLESFLLMSEQNLPLIDVEIHNLSGIAMQNNETQGGLSQEVKRSNKLVDDLLRINNTKNAAKKKKRSRRTSRKSRSLLSISEGKHSKILIGSVGSKSNKVSYIKGMLRFLSQHSNLSNSLFWTPATTRVSSLYAASDVFVINTQGVGETFGRVTIEAMAFGLPVLGTDAGGTKEIVEDKVTGLLHPVGQEGIQPLAQNLQFLLNNSSAREQLGRNGRLKVGSMYLKKHLYKKLAKVFVQCMKIK